MLSEKSPGLQRNSGMQMSFMMMSRHLMAVLMNFVVIGESVVKLSKEIKKQEPQVPWNRIKDLEILLHIIISVWMPKKFGKLFRHNCLF
jgi:hypothetical protein